MRSEPGTVNETVEPKEPEISIDELRERGAKFQPNSTSVKLCTYLKQTPDAESGLLLIDFHGGSSYVYHEIPVSVWDGIIGAPSTGSYIHRIIKGQFKYERIGAEKK